MSALLHRIGIPTAHLNPRAVQRALEHELNRELSMLADRLTMENEELKRRIAELEERLKEAAND